MKNNIFICENNKQDFSIVQKFIIDVLNKVDVQYCDKNKFRTLILVNDNINSLFLNVRATLWYYNGCSYPHLVSDDNLVDEAFIVITTKIEYLFENINKFKKVISIYNNINIKQVEYINKVCELFLIEINYKNIELELIKSKISFMYKKCLSEEDTLDNNIECNDYFNYDELNVVDKEFNKKDISDDNQDSKFIHKYEDSLYNNIFKGMNLKENNRDLEVFNDKALFIIKPRVVKIKMEFIILNKLLENGFLVLKYLKRKMSKEFWESFYRHINHKDFFNSYCNYMSSDFVGIAIIYNKNDVFSKIRNLIGPTNPKDCKPFHLRFQFGLDLNDNGMHASDSIDSFKHEMEVLKNFKIVI